MLKNLVAMIEGVVLVPDSRVQRMPALRSVLDEAGSQSGVLDV